MFVIADVIEKGALVFQVMFWFCAVVLAVIALELVLGGLLVLWDSILGLPKCPVPQPPGWWGPVGGLVLAVVILAVVALSPSRGRSSDPLGDLGPMTPHDPWGYSSFGDFQKATANVRGVLVIGVPDRHVGGGTPHHRVSSGFQGLADGEYSFVQYKVENKVPGREPGFVVVNKTKTPCPNCTSCTDCKCSGSGYYCPGACEGIYQNQPIRSGPYILRRHFDGSKWHQWWEVEKAVPPAAKSQPYCPPGGS